jgi:hypothetical protein
LTLKFQLRLASLADALVGGEFLARRLDGVEGELLRLLQAGRKLFMCD